MLNTSGPNSVSHPIVALGTTSVMGISSSMKETYLRLGATLSYIAIMRIVCIGAQVRSNASPTMGSRYDELPIQSISSEIHSLPQRLVGRIALETLTGVGRGPVSYITRCPGADDKNVVTRGETSSPRRTLPDEPEKYKKAPIPPTVAPILPRTTSRGRKKGSPTMSSPIKIGATATVSVAIGTVGTRTKFCIGIDLGTT
mmetsp:Transcript_9823/g.13887  ORF Transcript_9823/g.13887 Transcript_9823/m.13887 type:complete len:200 (+) Transcript_9823:131-730(+)